MNLYKLIKELHPLENKIILAFRKKLKLTTVDLISFSKLSPADVQRASQWLLTKGILELISKEVRRFVTLTELGKGYVKNGLPEMRLINLLNKKGYVQISDLDFESSELSGAIGELKSKNIIDIKAGVIKLLSTTGIGKFTEFQEFLNKVNKKKIDIETLSPSMQAIVESRARKRGTSRNIFRIVEDKKFTYKLTETGKKVLKILEREGAYEEISQLTPELLKDGKWRGKKFREYNIEISAPRIVIGRPHPYQSFLNHVRKKLISMGFCEITGELVETEFWNMDALFMPQFHPAREIHDVYFVRSPKYGDKIEPSVLTKVIHTHQDGGNTGSKGWGYKFNKKQTRRLVLRSQGTALSVRILASHPTSSGKYFAIARCFRPEAIDSTHASEFFQIEGIVVNKDINIKALLGLLQLFGMEIAQASEIKFLPDYFPFTEPSVQLHARSPKLGWIELGGAGIFRPEVTLPLGVKVPVIAWGLGLDRMAMVALNIQDIRDLFSKELEFSRQIVYKPFE